MVCVSVVPCHIIVELQTQVGLVEGKFVAVHDEDFRLLERVRVRACAALHERHVMLVGSPQLHKM